MTDIKPAIAVDAALTRELETLLRDVGAALVGFADLKGFSADGLNTGVSVALPLPRDIVATLADGPFMAYFDMYHDLNRRLDSLVTLGTDFLQAKGYRAKAQTRDSVREGEGCRTPLPHKTVATRAGLGWIGKCALLVTERYGSAIRLSSLVTDAPLCCGEPVTESRCGGCTACRNLCPGEAVSGVLWHAGLEREAFFDAEACRRAARALSAERLDREITLCGHCIAACPHTLRYLRTE